MKKKLRRIVVQGQTYLWKFTPGYVATGDPTNPWQCHDHFTAYLLEAKNSPLHISFRTWEDPIVGGPLRTGLPLDLADLQSGYQSDVPGINLHTPKHAAWLIRQALQTGWQPERSTKPFVVEQGVEWLMQRS